MADVNATFNYDADFSSAITQTRLLSRELSVLNNSFNSLDKDARKVRDRLGEIFKADVGDLGAFSARTVDITSNMDNFGKALDRNKLKLRDYAREARKAFQADSNSRKLAEDQVRRTKANLVDMGMDASGRRKGILVTPLTLDMSDMQTKLEVSRKQFSIFNKLVNDGATQLINWGKNTQWAGRQLTVGLTVPMTIFATTTIKAFNDVDKELTRFQKVYGSDLVSATTQATNAIRQQVQALAIDIAGAYGIAAKETAGLAADLAATGLEGQKLLDSIKQTTRLSVLGEIDRQDAMKTTLSLQNAFNMSTQELAESINFLNAVENQTSLSLQDLTEAIPKVGPVVRALGGDVKDLSVLMVAMKEGGINAAEGANALKSGLASLINPTKAGSEVAKQYGIDLEDIVKRNKGQLLPTVLEFQKSMETLDDLGKAKIIEQLFGKYQFARISALFDNLNTQGSQTKQVIELMSASNTDLARIANAEIKTLTESASMRFKRSMEAIKAALLPVGEAIVNSVLPFMEKFAGVLDRIVSFAQNLPGPIKSFLKIAGGLTAIAGPLIMMTGVLGNFLGYIVKGAMAFVNLGRTIRGLPTEKFALMDDAQIAASKATDVLTVSVERQKTAMIGLNQIMMDYYALINKQAAKTPNLFTAPVQAAVPGAQSSARPVVKRLKRQKGGPAWVPGSGSGDKIPAMLEPGEFVINRNAAKQYGGVLEDINNGVPRFQSGGKILRLMSGGPRRPGWRLRREAGEDQAPETRPNPNRNPDDYAYGNITNARVAEARQASQNISQIMSRLDNASSPADFSSQIPEIIRNAQLVKSIKIREPGETKPFPASSTYPMPKPLNVLYNDFLPGKSSDTGAFSYALNRIASDPTLTPEQKRSLFRLVSNGDAPGDPQLISFMSTVFREVLEQGLMRGSSQSVAAKMALAATVPTNTGVLRPMSTELGDIVAQSRTRSITGITENPSSWIAASRKLGLESLPQAAQSRSATQATELLARTMGISNEEARRLISAQQVGQFQVSHAQSGGVIRAMRGVKMPESYATKLSTIRQSMANANKEAMDSNVPLMELGTRQSKIGGHSSAIPGVNGIYEINGQRYVVKGHDTYESAKAEADMARITREVFGLQTPNQEAVRIRHPETGDLMFAVRSPYNEAFAKTTGRFTQDSAFDQLIASVARRDKDLQADNLFDNIVTDVGQAGIMSKASQPRTKTGPGNSALEQLAINLGMVKGGARSHGAEAWNAATANMTDAQIISRIKEAAAKAKSKLSTSDIPEDFKYIAKDLDDIASADLAPFVAHLRTVFPKEKKPPTAAAIAKKEQQKLLDREERQSALAAGYPQWAMQSGGMIPGYSRGRTSKASILMKQSAKAAAEMGMTPMIRKESQLTYNQSMDDLISQGLYHGSRSGLTADPMSFTREQRKRLQEYIDLGVPKELAIQMMASGQTQATMKRRDGYQKQNIFGADLFLTADAKLASTYSKGPGAAGVFRAEQDSAKKRIIDLSHSGRSLMAQDPTLVRDVYNRILQMAKNPPLSDIQELGKAGAKKKYVDMAKMFLAQEGSPSRPRTTQSRAEQAGTYGPSGYDRSKMFQDGHLAQIFRHVATQRGWDGLTHLGGVNTSGTHHQVIALFDAQGIKLKKTDNQDFSSFKQPEITRFEDFQSRKPKTKAPVYYGPQRENLGVQTGGMIRAQDGAWVPGKGEGDRVPALLEPGEFVVNKKAAMKYGGMLEDMNWNVAPRFMRGTPPTGQMAGMSAGAVSGGLMAASMASSMMLPVNKFTDALNKSIMALSAFTGILSAMQMLGMRSGGALGKKMSLATIPKTGSMAEKSYLKGAFKVEDAKEKMKMGGVGNKLRGARGLSAGKALMGVGRTAALMTNPIGWAIAATMAVTSAVLAYKKALDSAKKAAQQVFGASKAEAEAFGVELRSVADAIKSNQEYTKQIGAQAQQSQNSTPGRLDPEKEKIVLDSNKELTGRLRNLGETKLLSTVDAFGDGTNRSSQRTSLLAGKYASLLQEGFSEEDANIMVKTLAKASGAMESYYEAQKQFGSINAGDGAGIVKAQMEALSTFNIDAIGGEEGAFASGIKEIVSNLNLLPPEDQYAGLKELLNQIENLNTDKLKVAQQALVDMAQQNYGEDSQLARTLAAIQDKTEGTGSILNPTSWDQFFGPEARNSQTQSTAVSQALTTAFETGAITDQQLEAYRIKIDADPDSLSEIEQEIDGLMKARNLKIKVDLDYKESLDNQLEANNKKIILEQQRMQDAMDAKEASMQKEEEAFKASQKAGQKYIKGKQEEIKVIDEAATKEIEAIEKQTDAYLKSLTKQDDANRFRAEQRGTMLGGLGALAEGDVFGFLDARQAAEENARQYSQAEEIKNIEEKRDATTEAIDLERDQRVEAIQAEIDKRQEALEKQAEGHEARMSQLQKEREQMAKNFAKSIADMQALSDGIAAIRGNDKILTWLNTIKDPFEKATQQAAIINYLITNPAATIEEAFKKTQFNYNQSKPATRTTGTGKEHPSNYSSPSTTSAPNSAGDPTLAASGGFISGPGTGTSDSIPARLSNGEYVVKASAVDQYGVAMMNSINEQRFADGGQVLDDYSRVTYGGKTFNARTVRMLKRAEESYGSNFGFYQGSYSTGVSASKGTHDGGGAVDIKPPANIDKALKALASAGFWAKWRGSMNPPHIHALATGDAQLSSAARRQLGLPADGGYEGDQVEVGTRTVEEAIKEVSLAGMGTVQELTDIMTKGAAAVYTPFTGRQFGGSMTMNKPYLVGENGPEVVMPYGSGSRVDPKFNVPSGSSIATVSQDSSDIINSNSYSNMVVNLSVSGVNDPNKAANKVIEILNSEASRRNHSRKMGR
jgi:TP901 family phage tail tape measure protein